MYNVGSAWDSFPGPKSDSDNFALHCSNAYLQVAVLQSKVIGYGIDPVSSGFKNSF